MRIIILSIKNFWIMPEELPHGKKTYPETASSKRPETIADHQRVPESQGAGAASGPAGGKTSGRQAALWPAGDELAQPGAEQAQPADHSGGCGQVPGRPPVKDFANGNA